MPARFGRGKSKEPAEKTPRPLHRQIQREGRWCRRRFWLRLGAKCGIFSDPAVVQARSGKAAEYER